MNYAHAPPRRRSLSNRLIPRPPANASSLDTTGGSCLWSPISASCSALIPCQPIELGERIERRTPRISGIRDAGSVDIDASSRNTTGKSTSFIHRLPEVMQVVQT